MVIGTIGNGLVAFGWWVEHECIAIVSVGHWVCPWVFAPIVE